MKKNKMSFLNCFVSKHSNRTVQFETAIKAQRHTLNKQGRVNSEAAMSNAMTKPKYTPHVLKVYI